jgi:archaellum component FlaC
MTKERKNKETTIDDLAVMIANEFGQVRKEMANGFRELKEEIADIKTRITKVEKDIIWIKAVLESHTTILRDLSEEKTFIVHRMDRIEKEVELIKKNLKIA